MTIGKAPDRARHEGIQEWACFAAQQSAEKAVKALHLFRVQESWGHTVARLLADLPLEVPGDSVEIAKVLGGFCLLTQYANGHPEGSPFDHHGPRQNRRAICYAHETFDFVRLQVA